MKPVNSVTHIWATESRPKINPLKICQSDKKAPETNYNHANHKKVESLIEIWGIGLCVSRKDIKFHQKVKIHNRKNIWIW
jgi:hypothetical protein